MMASIRIVGMAIMSTMALFGLDTYGGRTDISCAGGTQAHFYTEKVGGRWWLCTPAGHAFFDMQVDVVSEADSDTAPQGTSYHAVVVSKYGTATNYSAWAASQKSRLSSWGFNTVGPYSDWFVWGSLEPGPAMPYSVMLNLMRQAMKNQGGYASDGIHELQDGVDPTYYNGYFGTTGDIYDGKWITYYNNALTADVMGVNGQSNDPYLMYLIADDRDAFYGWGPGNQYGYTVPSWNLGWASLITNEKQWYTTGGYPPPNGLFNDPVVYSKLGLRDYLKSVAQYQTSGVADISKLNAAWGSSYTTWDSSGTAYTDTICSGQWNGTTTSCAVTLAHGNVGKQAVGVFVNGTIWAGDHINYNDDTTGSFGGASGASGSISYATGTMTITFTTPPPGGATVTVNYASNGFGFGSGLLDEDGRHSWVCSDYTALSNCNSNIKTDLNNFLYVFAKQYTTNEAAILHTHYPGILNACMGTLSNPDGGKTRDQFIKATAEDCDIVNVSIGSSDNGILPDATYANQMLSDTYAAMGATKKPMLPQREIVSNGDSAYAAFPCVSGSYDCATSQTQKGASYYAWMNYYLNAKESATGDYPIVGFEYWQYVDNVGEHNDFGLISNIDNAYDGHEDVTGSVSCSAPISTYTCGGEASNYTDAITQLYSANLLWQSITSSSPSSSLSGITLRGYASVH